MTRLARARPRVVVEGACTDRTPLESQPAGLAELFDQVHQNAERLRLLAREPTVVERGRVLGVRWADSTAAPRATIRPR